MSTPTMLSSKLLWTGGGQRCDHERYMPREEKTNTGQKASPHFRTEPNDKAMNGIASLSTVEYGRSRQRSVEAAWCLLE